MQIKTSRFGTIEVSEESIITLVRGMYGFEQYTRFCMINYKPGDSIWWIQSIDEPELAFVVADPAQLYNDYEFDIADADAEKLHLCKAGDAFIMVILTVAPGGTQVTANLAAPLILNQKEMLAVQLILQDGRYQVRHQLILSTPQQTSQEDINIEDGLVAAA